MVKKHNKPKSSLLANLPQKPRYVSRGGEKLRGALDAFQIDVRDTICMDVGASTGGFTDCLLQAGAQLVWSIDVGYGLLDYHLRNDSRVRLLERTNFREMDTSLITQRPERAVVDVSFISLDKILPKLRELLVDSGVAVVLIKPQFEGTPKEVPGGFVKDEPTRQAILRRVEAIIASAGFDILGQIDSPIKGRKGNQEALVYLKKRVQ